MANEDAKNDPGAELAIKLLEKAVSQSKDPVLTAIAEGVKTSIQVSCNNNTKISDHIEDENVHTFLGIMKQKNVLKWVLGTMFLIAFAIDYVPDLVKWLFGLF